MSEWLLTYAEVQSLCWSDNSYQDYCCARSKISQAMGGVLHDLQLLGAFKNTGT